MSEEIEGYIKFLKGNSPLKGNYLGDTIHILEKARDYCKKLEENKRNLEEALRDCESRAERYKEQLDSLYGTDETLSKADVEAEKRKSR